MDPPEIKEKLKGWGFSETVIQKALLSRDKKTKPSKEKKIKFLGWLELW